MQQQIRVLNRSLQGGQWSQIRSVAQVGVKTLEDANGSTVQSREWANAKPVTEIPGPTKFELIRGFLPGGVFYKKSLIEFSLLSRQMYGDLVRIPELFGKPSILLSFNPDDFPTVLRSEGVWPSRRGLETMNYHRSVHRKEDFEGVIGLLGSNNEAWGKVRSAVNPVLMNPKNVRVYLNKMLEVNDEFLQRVREIRDPKTLEMPDNFDDEINRLTFESVAVVALNQQIGLIRKNRDNPGAQKLFKTLTRLFQLIYELEVKPSLWKVVKTPQFHEMMKVCDTIHDTTMKYVTDALERLEKNPTAEHEEKSVLEKLLKIDKRIAVVMASDMLMAGVDTTSSSLVGILFGIAKSPEKQEKLRQELRTALPQKDSVLTVDSMKNLPYLRACIKEGMRLYPITSGTIRQNGEEIIMSGYQVPKHQDIIINSNLLLSEEKYYPQPKEFIPERWLRDTEKTNNHANNPFLYIPFGFGPRSCVGKRLVDLEMEITISRLVRNFYIEFNYPLENAFKNELINMPAIPLKFKMSEVEN